MRQKSKPITIKDYYNEKYKKSLDDTKGNDPTKEIDDFKLNVGKFSLKTRIKNNPWLKSGIPASKAISWLFKEVFKNPGEYKYNKMYLNQGQLFTFQYFNPKYKNTKQLPWFDKYPLLLSLGPVVTKLGVRNLGFNLHLVPPKVRIAILCTIFEMYKKLYRYQIFYKRMGPVQIKYQYLVKPLVRYGAGFCIRMYIPKKQQQIVVFPYTDWHKAIFIPSRAYDGIRANKLIQEWRKYVRKLGFGTTPNIKWQTQI
jgi:hypothetical protein